MPMKIAAVQMDLAWEDREANYASARRWAGEAATAGASYIVLPEMFATGFSMDPSITAEAADGPTPSFLQKLAGELQVTVSAGYVRKTATGKGVNTALTVGPDGQVLARYAKTHLIGILGEGNAHEAGDGPVVFPVEDLRCSGFICYDLRFPELFRLVADKVQLMTVMASWPSTRQTHWDTLLRARAIENQCYVLGVNRVGSGSGLDFDGGSVIINPLGEVISELAQREEGIVVADVFADDVADVRTRFPFLADRRF